MKTIILASFILFFIIPILGQKMTDRDLAGLKGNVKSVVVEDADLENKDGKLVEKQRVLEFDEFYDEKGNVTQESNYYIGDKNIYSFINGEKTMKFSHFETPHSIRVIAAPAMIEANPKPRDSRYDTKYQYTFDKQDRIIEEKQYHNDGSDYGEFIYKYNDKNQLIKMTRYNNSSADSETTYKYDDKGNQLKVKYVSLVAWQKSDVTHDFSDYIFDSQGNWIKRIQTTFYRDRDGKDVQSKTVYYRKITYHEN